MLPDANTAIDGAAPGTGRHVTRLREVSIQSMVGSTARARIKRAMRAKTQVPGQAHDYKLEQLVDYHRSGGSKDTSGWRGPARIIDASSTSRGSVTVRFQRDLPIE
eukprot:6279882-Alexandrium_andersonii.AAC.1